MLELLLKHKLKQEPSQNRKGKKNNNSRIPKARKSAFKKLEDKNKMLSRAEKCHQKQPL
jgi:hypothetical protein